MKKIFSLFAGAALAAASLQPAAAHSFIDHAIPPIGAVVAQAPSTVILCFTQAIEGAFSTIEVRNAAGVRIDRRDTRSDPANPEILFVSLPALPDGIYQVTWRVVAVDSHKTMGDFLFTVKKQLSAERRSGTPAAS